MLKFKLGCYMWAEFPSHVQLPSGLFWPLGSPMSDWAFVPWIILASFLSF